MKHIIKKVMMGLAVVCLGAFAVQAQGETPVMSLAVSEMEAVVTVPADRRVPMTLRLVWGNSDAERADVATVTASGGVFRASMKDFNIPDGTKVHAELVSLYDVVEYVESHGTEYVSVGTTLADGIKVSMDAQFTSDEGTQTAWGFSANGNCWFGCANAQYHFGQKSLVISPLSRSSTSVYYETTSRQYVLIDEFSYDQSSSASASDTLKIFASGSTPGYFTQMKLWAFTVENVARGETLVDFVPIRNDGIGALYDVVHDVVYEAQIKAGEEGGLSCGETILSVGGCFGVSNEVDFERLCVVEAGENSLAADGNPHQCSVRVLYPADGYEVKWAWSNDLAAFVHDEPESFTEVGEYRNAVRVTCEGCRPWQGESVLRILAADSHREVSARQASNDAIVISWGAHFEKMDVYIVWDEEDHPDATNLCDWPNSQLALSLTDASEPGEAEFARPDGARYVRVVTLKSHTGVGIEYLESLTSTGTQILDLGYQMTATTGVEIDISMSNGSGSNSSVPFFGAYDGTSPGSAVGTQCMIWYYGSGTYRLYLTANKVDSSRQVVTSTPGERETLKIDPDKTFSIGSVSKAIGANSQIPQNNLAVFGVSKAGGFNAAATQKYNPTVYEVRLYEGETLVRQFRPASVDGTATMVDVLDESRQASNVGTTTDFIRGAEIPLIGQTVERFDFGPAFSQVMATVENYAGIADGQAHAATVTVVYPSKGYTIRWAEASDDPDYSITEPPAYSEVGMYTNLVKITAPEIDPFYGECVVTIAEVDPVLASPKGLKISVLGDSWSTLSGVTKNQVIGGEGTSYYYPKSGNDVDTTAEMWWKITADALGMTVDTVDAWGGSGVSMASSASTTKFGSSMLNRVEGLGDPDVIVIMPVGNDNWIHISLRGETTAQMVGDYCYDPKGWTFDSASAATQKASSLYGYRAALACLLTRVHNRYPRARLYYAVSWSANSVNSDALKESAEEVCAHYGVPFCPMVSSAVEIDSGSHPTVAGQLKVAEYMTNLISNDFIRAAALVYEDENVKSNDAGLQRKVVNGDTVYVSTNSSKRVGIVTKRPMILNRTLLVGGGGAGGQTAGGGGAGGAVAAGAPAAVFPAGERLTLRVGAGGDFIAAAGRETNEAKKKILQYCRGGSAADIWFNGLNGQPTTLNYGKVTLSAAGGGGGGGWGDNASYLSTVTVGQNGASGGGGTRDAAGGAATAGFGGGAGASATLSTGGAGGGGGAGSAGANAAAGASGIGGAGVTDDITGESLNYGAGGGGGGYTMQNAAVPTVSAGAAGGTSAGAGSAGATYGFAGKDGFGGGGGGGGYGFETGDATAFGYVGGKGGDGSVSLRFSMNFDQVVASVEDYVGIVDGQAHAATVTVAYPESDYEILWAEVSDNPNYSITEPPAYSEIGSYTNLVKITVPDLDPFYGECVVEILPNMAIGADAYVQSGLIAQWDGIENAGAGQPHDPVATYPKEIKSGIETTLTGTMTAGDDYFALGSGALQFTCSEMITAVNAGDATVEICLEKNGSIVNNGGFVALGNANRAFWLWQYGANFIDACSYDNNGNSASIKFTGDDKNTLSFQLGASTEASAYLLNGTKQGDITRGSTKPSTTEACRIGQLSSSFTAKPNAKVYSIRLYSRKLTDEEVALNVAVDKIRFDGANPEDVLPNGYHWNPWTGKIEKPIVAAVTGATGPADGTAYSCTLTVTDPADGYTAKWFDASTSTYSLDLAPSYTAEGVYTNLVKVTAEDYLDFCGMGVVTVVAAEPEPPVEPTDDVEVIGANETLTVEGELVYVFSTVGENVGTVTLTDPTRVDILVVGGGGGGGSVNGGGGGGGGVVYLQDQVLPAGTYTIDVGAGGAKPAGYGGKNANCHGGDGGDSSFGTWIAKGGGGGGYWQNGAGNAGGCGGGGNGSGAGGASNQELYDGAGHGTAGVKSGSIDYGGGGGGAGTAANGMTGGDGYPCSITSENLYYGAGGGAGQGAQGNSTAYPGGLGGGGTGGKTVGGNVSATAGSFYGAGGGGGRGSTVAESCGAAGYQGVVIVRVKGGDTPAPPTPVEPTVVTVTPNAGQAKTVGAADPVLTYTLSENIEVTGALARATGETVGTYAINLGTLGAADPAAYTLELAATPVYFSITAAPEPGPGVTVGADAYVQSGLIAQWDGIENVEAGQPHDPSATYPREIKSSIATTLTGTMSAGDNYFALGSGALKFTCSEMITAVNAGDATVEICLEKNGSYVNNGGLVSLGNTKRAFWLWQASAYFVDGCSYEIQHGGSNSDIKFTGDNKNTLSFQLGANTANSSYLLNGAKQNTITRGTVQPSTSENCYIGQLNSSFDYKANAKVYSIRLYSRKLTDVEVALNVAVDKIRFDGANPEDVLPEGYRWNPQTGKIEKPIVAAVTGATGPADGTAYSCTLTVTDPADGYTAKWFDASTSTYSLDLAPSYTAEGVYTNLVKVTAEDYLDFCGMGVVTVVAAEPEPPVEPTDPTVVTVTPDAGQAKTVGDDDPTLTYTLSQDIEVTGTLAREEGETVGNYAITLGTLKAADESAYTLVLAATPVNFEIKAAPEPGPSVTVGADAYVQNGLIAQWDGIENVGAGQPHDPAATYPKEIKSGIEATLTGTMSAGDDYFALGSGALQFTCSEMMTAVNAGDATVEICLEKNGNYVGNGGIVSLGNTKRAFWLWQGSSYLADACSYENAGGNSANIRFTGDDKNTLSFQLGADTENSSYLLNGTKQSTITRGTVQPSTSESCYIGQLSGSLNYKSRAKVYSIRLYSRKLTDVEVALNVAVDKIRFDGANPEDVLPEGYRWNPQTGKIEKPIAAEVTGARGPVDGTAYSCTLTVTDPADGYTAKWFDASTSTYALNLAPSYTEEGVYTNLVKVTAEGYADFYGTGVVMVANAADIYVAPAPAGNDDTGDGSQGNPYATIAKGVAAAKAAGARGAPSATVHVGAGTYEECGFDLDAVIKIVGTGTTRDDVIIDAKSAGRAFTLSADGAMLANLTVQNGQTSVGMGANVYMTADGVVSNCVIKDATLKVWDGKGANVSMTQGTLTDCKLIGGVGDGSHSALGSAIYATGGRICRCEIRDAVYQGAGTIVVDLDGAATFENSLICNCKAGSGASYNPYVLKVNNANAKVINCTVIDNVTAKYGIRVENGLVVNTVIYANGGTAEMEWGNANAASFVNCAFAAGLKPAGTECIDTVTDAAFADYATGDYTPKAGGALVDTGDTEGYATYGATSATDLAGNERIVNDRIDIGAYELQPPTPPEPGIQVGDNLTATFKNGTCTISGTGAMWDKSALTELRKLAITDLIIGEGVTSIGASAFEKMKSIHNVTIGSTVTSIGQQTFHKCYNLTNVVIHTGATAPTVGEYAFFRCNSLVRITVTGASSVNWGENAFTLQAGIFMNSATGLPEIYPIPEVVDANGSATVLYGTNDLNGDWTKINSNSDRANYHFFKIVIE